MATQEWTKIPLEETSHVVFVDDVAGMSKLVDSLDGLPTSPPSIFIDLEGINLSRHGTISIMQIYVPPAKRTYLVDVFTLRQACFSTPGETGRTLKGILESDHIPKVFFDVRNDSDALYAHFHIDLAGIQDLQLMELATRTFSRKFVNGLSKCIERDAPMSAGERHAWVRTKEKGIRLFAPEKGGSYQVFNQRPLPEDLMLYCAQDVQNLPGLWAYYNSKMSEVWWGRVIRASRERVLLSQSPTFDGKGRQNAYAPKGWYEIGMWF